LDAKRWWSEQAVLAAGDPHYPGHASFGAFVDARVALHLGQFDDAPSLVAQAFGEFPYGRHVTYAQAAGAELAVAAGLPHAAELIARARPDAAENRWATACLARAEARLTGDR